MEKLTINIPDKQSSLVKQILKGLGVTFQHETHASPSAYKEKLTLVQKTSSNLPRGLRPYVLYIPKNQTHKNTNMVTLVIRKS